MEQNQNITITIKEKNDDNKNSQEDFIDADEILGPRTDTSDNLKKINSKKSTDSKKSKAYTEIDMDIPNDLDSLTSIQNIDNIIEEQEKKTNSKKIKGWNQPIQNQIVLLICKLKYNRTISNYFFYSLKTKENNFSWIIIVLATFTSAISLLNFETEPFPYFNTLVNVILSISAIFTTLIAAWIKKQHYVERINSIDRYLQKLNKLIEEIEVQLVLIPDDRQIYDKFKEVYLKQITEYLSTSPAMSPFEWKKTVYEISVYYPELISPDKSAENKLWPWYSIDIGEKNKLIRKMTSFRKMIMNTYNSLLCCRTCCNPPMEDDEL